MKKFPITARSAAIALSAAALAASFAGAPAFAQAAPHMLPPMGAPMPPHAAVISVSGSGTVYAKPDMAMLQVSVHREGPTAAEAAAQLKQDLPALLAELKKLLPEKDMQTSGWSVGPVYNQDAKQPEKFAAETQLTLKIRSTDQVGAVIDTALAKGANGMGGLSWINSEPQQLYLAAEAKAVADAQAKIDAYAKAAGGKARRILRISEQGGGAGPRPVLYSMRMSDSTPMEAGENAITAQIQVVAEMLPPKPAGK